MPANDLKRFFADVLSILSTTMQKEGLRPYTIQQSSEYVCSGAIKAKVKTSAEVSTRRNERRSHQLGLEPERQQFELHLCQSLWLRP